MADPNTPPPDPSVNVVGNVLKGLPIQDLVAAPLMAACDAQIRLAQSMANFVRTVGFMPQKSQSDRLRALELDFSMTRPNRLATGEIVQEKVDMSVPVLAIVPIPNLQVDNVSVDFEINIETQFMEASSTDVNRTADFDQEGRCGGPSIKTHGSVAQHHEQTRKTDITARYAFHVEAKQQPPPEGLMKLLDILNTACAPRAIAPATDRPSLPAK